MITEQEKSEIKVIADDLAYLMTEAHNAGYTFDQIKQFMTDPRSIISIDAGDEDLQRIAALIYAHAQCLQFTDYTISMSEGQYKVTVKFYPTPF